MRNHARGALACDFFVVITATFRSLYVFVILEVGTRRILHWNVTAHPTAEWTTQQFRMVMSGDSNHQFVIHDRDSIYSEGVDATLVAMGPTVLKTPVRAPQANAYAERFVRSIKEECLDRMIPIGERHFRRAVAEYVEHYHQERNHQGLDNRLIAGTPVIDITSRVQRRPRLGGLLNFYERAA